MRPRWVSWMPSLRQDQREAADVGGDQIHQQHRADQVAAGKHRDFETAGCRGPPDEPALEILFLDEIQAEPHLRQRPGKHQHQRRGETKEGEAQRGDSFQQSVESSHHSGLVKRTDSRNAVNFAFSAPTSASGPVSLKNQVSAPWRVQPAARRVCGPVISMREMVLGPAVTLETERRKAGLIHRAAGSPVAASG